MSLFSNPGVDQSKSALNQAVGTSGMLGAQASGIGANLTPFLTQEMLHPQGYGQQDLSAMTAAAEGGAGGATAGLTGQAEQRTAASHNAGGYQAALDAAARDRTKAAAGASEGIASQNAGLKQQQMQEGAGGLQSLYGTDTSGMLNAMGQQHEDINSEVAAQQAGPAWMTDLSKGIGLAGGVAGLAGGFHIPGFTGFKGVK
jgi:hypothetical protein